MTNINHLLFTYVYFSFKNQFTKYVVDQYLLIQTLIRSQFSNGLFCNDVNFLNANKNHTYGTLSKYLIALLFLQIFPSIIN